VYDRSYVACYSAIPSRLCRLHELDTCTTDHARPNQKTLTQPYARITTNYTYVDAWHACLDTIPCQLPFVQRSRDTPQQLITTRARSYVHRGQACTQRACILVSVLYTLYRAAKGNVSPALASYLEPHTFRCAPIAHTILAAGGVWSASWAYHQAPSGNA